jgi:hypothetical protein
LWSLAEECGFAIEVTWNTSQSPDCFDVYLQPLAAAGTPIEVRASVPQDTPWSDLANDPLDSSFRQELVPELREFAKSKLPEYMLPAAWMVLKELPLTPAGKVDRRALRPPQSRPEEMGEYIAPRNELERSLAEMWAQVLRVDQVGVEDNFFDLGGHSLLATRVVTQMSHLLDMDIPLRVLFDRPTIEGLGAHVLDQLAEGLREAS